VTRLGALLAAALVTLASEVAAADEPAPPPLVSAKPKPEPELRWDEERPRFRVVEYVLTGVVGPLASAGDLLAAGAAETTGAVVEWIDAYLAGRAGVARP